MCHVVWNENPTWTCPFPYTLGFTVWIIHLLPDWLAGLQAYRKMKIQHSLGLVKNFHRALTESLTTTWNLSKSRALCSGIGDTPVTCDREHYKSKFLYSFCYCQALFWMLHVSPRELLLLLLILRRGTWGVEWLNNLLGGGRARV